MSAINLAATKIREANSLIIASGAGMGVDSGLPDFRGSEGFWKAYPPIKELGLSFSQMSNPRWFEDNPRLAWGFFGHRATLYRDTVPHEGFSILRDMCRDKSHFLFTSNVDGQFQKAGFDADKIVECHGSIHHLQCTEPYECVDTIWKEEINLEVDENFRAQGDLPKCPHCNRLARPNIMMFGDSTFVGDRADEQENRLRRWMGTSEEEYVILEIGSGEDVPSVRLFTEKSAKGLNATLIRINPSNDRVSGKPDIHLKMGALKALKAIQEAM